jgi:osmotically-inducible protein OsmY
MNLEHPSPSYLVGHIKDALATDERTHMLDVSVKVHELRVFLIGRVTCEARRLAAEQVARELIPGDMAVVNSLCVESYPEPSQPEPLD